MLDNVIAGIGGELYLKLVRQEFNEIRYLVNDSERGKQIVDIPLKDHIMDHVVRTKCRVSVLIKVETFHLHVKLC